MATSIDVLDQTGKKSGSVELPADVFDVVTNIPLMHQVVVAQLAAARQGTHKAKALLSALSDRARADRIHVVQGLGTEKAPSTKVASSLLAQTAPGFNVLVVIGRDDVNGQKSVRNIPGIHYVHPDQLNAYDVLNSDDIVFTAEAFASFVAEKSEAKGGK